MHRCVRAESKLTSADHRRGGVVAEDDPVWALKNGVTNSVAMDDHEIEPLSPDSPLLQPIDNLAVTPHLAAISSTFRELGAAAVDAQHPASRAARARRSAARHLLLHIFVNPDCHWNCAATLRYLPIRGRIKALIDTLTRLVNFSRTAVLAS
jgi:D-isomer specific 2-hydroxyacid dehydrogenase, NAD binding domain